MISQCECICHFILWCKSIKYYFNKQGFLLLLSIFTSICILEAAFDGEETKFETSVNNLCFGSNIRPER